MIRRLARTGAPLLTAALLLTACSRPDDAPAAHPVFGQKLDRQVFLALRRTQQDGNAAFTQTITFTSKKGRAVQTVSGRMDFAKGAGAATATWELAPGLPKDVRDTALGLTPGKGNADASGRMLVDRRTIRYRAGSAAYWLEYRTGDAPRDVAGDSIDALRGSEAPIGGTLLEGLGATRATSQRTDGPGRVYRAEMPASTAWDVFPDDLRRHLSAGFERVMSYRTSAPLPATVSVDGRGRVTHVRADFSSTLGRKDGVFKDMTSLTIDLRLSGHGTSQPAVNADAPVRAAGEAVRGIESVERGGCIDFSTGQRYMATVVVVPCTGPHHGRVFAQEKVGPRTYPGAGAARRKAGDACSDAYRRASGDWTDASDEPGHFWFMWSSEGEWNDEGGQASCYVVTGKKTAEHSRT
ncbi:hypothetical protein AB0E88_05770 [Streptomyces sp. NPDC028635]|uniref:hypothetical protein n=1 Tax=Streptomyces sp. NPDC028635 TaxID=3154800 RepID=UPI0033EE1716